MFIVLMCDFCYCQKLTKLTSYYNSMIIIVLYMVVAVSFSFSDDTFMNTVENQACSSNATPMKATPIFQYCCLKLPYHCRIYTPDPSPCT